MPPSPSILADLHAAYLAGNLLCFVGAGVPKAAGLDDWLMLAQRLLERMRREGKSPDAVQEVETLICRRQLIDALSAAKLSLGVNEFNNEVDRAVDDTQHTDPPDLALAIAELRPRLRAVLTTNLDGFLEKAFQGTWPAMTSAPGNLAQERQYVLKLHGTRLDRQSWVFTREQYDSACFARPQDRHVFEALFRACPIMFVGFGMVDDDLEQILAQTRALAGAQPPQHFAFMRGPLAPFQRKRLDDAGVRLLIYDDHAELPGLVRGVAS